VWCSRIAPCRRWHPTTHRDYARTHRCTVGHTGGPLVRCGTQLESRSVLSCSPGRRGTTRASLHLHASDGGDKERCAAKRVAFAPGNSRASRPGHGDLTHLSMQDACMPTYVRAFALAPPVHAFSRASLGSRSYRRVSIPLTCARLRRTSTTFRDHDIGRDARRYTLLRH
jgi:hypothetical protein